MPIGVASAPVRCKKCDTMWENFSALRKHQWKDHRESFQKLIDSGKVAASKQKGKKWSARQTKKYRATLAAKKASRELTKLEAEKVIAKVQKAVAEPVPELTARELLRRLKLQAEFMRDVVTLVEGMMS